MATGPRVKAEIPVSDKPYLAKEFPRTPLSGNPPAHLGIRSIPKRLRMNTVNQKKPMVTKQLTASADQNPQPCRNIQGKMRNIGSVGSTNQKVPSAWFANRSGS